ncbi:HTH CENPB-type domain-containing protein [Mycena kentingensis (nom. inval.)]|nr:HTH CENPB-type domain-containing protein [Mycena kentingensis (nom. inval.)]
MQSYFAPPNEQPWSTLYPSPIHNPQIESSIGPSRVTTRSSKRLALGRDQASRPPSTPPHHDPRAPTAPAYYPLTPSTVSPSLSPYHTDFRSAHSRSNSISTNLRSGSPASSTHSSQLTCNSVISRRFADSPDSQRSERPKKQRLFNTQRREICQYHLDNPNARQEDIARQFNVERSTVSKILKNKTKWLNVDVNETLKIAKHRPSKFPEIETEMIKWLLDCRDTNTVGDGRNVRAARALGLGPRPGELSAPSDTLLKDGSILDEGSPMLEISLLSSGNDGRQDEANDRPPWLDNPSVASPTEDVTQSPAPTVHRPLAVRPAQLSSVPAASSSWLPSDTEPAPTPLTTHQPLAPPTQWLPQSIPTSNPHPPPVQRTMSDPGPALTPPQVQVPQYDAPVEMTQFAALYQHHVEQQQQHQEHVSPPQPPPTISDAEVALGTLINFFDTNGQNMLESHDRHLLDRIKYSLRFQAADADRYTTMVASYAPGEPVAH